MSIHIMHIWGSISYALTQVILLRYLSKKTYKIFLLFIFFIELSILMLMSIAFQWGDKLLGLILCCFVIPILLITITLTIAKKQFCVKYLKYSVLTQTLTILTDIITRAFSRILSASISEIVYYLSMPICALFISHLLSSLHIKIKNLPLKEKKLLYICFANMFACLMIFIIFFPILQYNGIRDKPIFLFSVFLFFSITSSNLISIVLYGKYITGIYTSMMKEDELECLMKYAGIIEDTYENLRILKHDYKNILYSISESSDNAIKDELLRLLENNIKNIGKYDDVKNLSLIKNMSIKALLSSKLIHFMNHHINIRFEMLEAIQDFYISDFDLVRALGIVLDNAFEEAENTDAKWLKVTISKMYGSTVLTVENSCRESIPDPEAMMKKGFSTKGYGRGIGLANFRNIVDSYPYCSYQMGLRENNIFFIKLTLANN